MATMTKPIILDETGLSIVDAILSLGNKSIAIKLNNETIVPVDNTFSLSVITETVNNLVNYYKKSETYTKDEINSLINNISAIHLEIVSELPVSNISTSTIYLTEDTVNGGYVQHIYNNNQWVDIGSTTINLANYYTKSEIDNLFNNIDVATSTTTGVVKPDNSSITVDNDGTIHSINTEKIYKGTRANFLSLTETEQNSYSIRMFTDEGPEIATTEKVSVVKPDGVTITIDNDGTIHSVSQREIEPSYNKQRLFTISGDNVYTNVIWNLPTLTDFISIETGITGTAKSQVHIYPRINMVHWGSQERTTDLITIYDYYSSSKIAQAHFHIDWINNTITHIDEGQFGTGVYVYIDTYSQFLPPEPAEPDDGD